MFCPFAPRDGQPTATEQSFASQTSTVSTNRAFFSRFNWPTAGCNMLDGISTRMLVRLEKVVTITFSRTSLGRFPCPPQIPRGRRWRSKRQCSPCRFETVSRLSESFSHYSRIARPDARSYRQKLAFVVPSSSLGSCPFSVWELLWILFSHSYASLAWAWPTHYHDFREWWQSAVFWSAWPGFKWQ